MLKKQSSEYQRYMPACPDRFPFGAVIFFACLNLEQKSSFMDRHYFK